jgi:hypothetical protein
MGYLLIAFSFGPLIVGSDKQREFALWSVEKFKVSFGQLVSYLLYVVFS